VRKAVHHTRGSRRVGIVAIVVAIVSALAVTSIGGVAGAKSAAAPGVTAGEVKVGVWVQGNAVAANQQAGTGTASLATSGNTAQDIYQRLIDDVNKRGGLQNHKIVPVFFTYDATSTEPIAVQDQAACAKWTQDDHVFAALIGPYHTDTLVNCLEKAGVLTLQSPGFALVDDQTLSKYKHFVLAGSMSVDSIFKAMVAGAVADKFFAKGSKVGLVTYDTPDYQRAVKAALLPALKKANVKLVEQISVAPITSAAAYADAQPKIASGVLRLKAAGVDRVLLLGSSGLGSPLLTSLGAQQYAPRIAMTSADTPYFLTIAKVPGDVLKGAVGVGWMPSVDINGKPNAVATTCNTLLQAAGIPASNAVQGPVSCDHVALLEAAVKAAGSLDRDAIVKTLPKMAAMQLGSNDLNHFGPNRSAALRYARLAYDPGCKCFAYTSKLTG
jgi:ABC-type branched-subunit amino acid transport system substrate-binding protein